MLIDKIETNLTERGFTRRHIGRVMSLLTAGAALPFFNEAALAQLSSLGPNGLPPGAVKINSNESGWSPSNVALQALDEAASMGNRYARQYTSDFVETVAKSEGLTTDNVIPYPGSSLALHHGVIAFTSPQRGLVTADPGYEAAGRAADYIGARVTKVGLKAANAAHDVKAMLAADPNAGVFYICNPNNPTGSITPRPDIEWLIANKPAGSIVLLDEAYIHFSNEPFGSDLVKAGKDVVVLRTFSKIYSMAGLRAGMALGRKDLLEKMDAFQGGAMPSTGMAGAAASLRDPTHVPTRKKMVADLRTDLMEFCAKNDFPYAPSESCKVMIDAGRPAKEVIAAMQAELVYIGRPWPAWPNHVRVSIGTAPEMEKFKTAFLKVLRS